MGEERRPEVPRATHLYIHLHVHRVSAPRAQPSALGFSPIYARRRHGARASTRTRGVESSRRGKRKPCRARTKRNSSVRARGRKKGARRKHLGPGQNFTKFVAKFSLGQICTISKSLRQSTKTFVKVSKFPLVKSANSRESAAQGAAQARNPPTRAFPRLDMPVATTYYRLHT
jgi:hypothetical protein